MQYAHEFVSHGSTPQNVQAVARALIEMDEQACRLIQEIEQIQEVLRRRR